MFTKIPDSKSTILDYQKKNTLPLKLGLDFRVHNQIDYGLK